MIALTVFISMKTLATSILNTLNWSKLLHTVDLLL